MQSNFDVYEFVNKTYAESALYEINDVLVDLSKSLSKTKHQNKQLISANFSKFVQCRAVLENIYDDIKSKNLQKEITKHLES